MKGSGRKIEGEFGIEVANATPDQPEQGSDDTDPEQDGNFPDGGDLAIQKGNQQKNETAGDYFCLNDGERVQVSGVARKANGSGSNRKRSLHKSLPDKEERHQTPPAAGAVGFAEEHIGAAGSGHGGTELRPDEAVERGQ